MTRHHARAVLSDNEAVPRQSMSAWFRSIILVVGAVAVFATGICLLDYRAMSSPRRAAAAMVQAGYQNDRYVDNAAALGDRFVLALREESRDFEMLDEANAQGIAKALAEVDTDVARDTLLDLAGREVRMQRLVGLYGLVRQGSAAQFSDAPSFLGSVIDDATTGHQSPELACLGIEALCAIGTPESLPPVRLLMESRGVNHLLHVTGCRQIARYQNRDLISVLEECLKDEGFKAADRAFSALIAMGYRRAVPLAIARLALDEELQLKRKLVRELSQATGQHYGLAEGDWLRWWDSVRGEWSIPPR